jgi:hypothetical protein
MRFDIEEYWRLYNEAARAIEEGRRIALEKRRCVALTLAGEQCQNFAIWDNEDHLCASHFHKKRRGKLTAEERKAEKEKKKRRRGEFCMCPAYPFPHRLANGLCRYPDPSISMREKKRLGRYQCLVTS